jgi:hypothetical protein
MNNSGNDERFQDRKLNACDVCGTRKMLAFHYADNGRCYFLCKGHTLLNDQLTEAEKPKRRVIKR